MTAPVDAPFWSRWRNPVLREPGAALKDPCCAWHDGAWHWFYSRVQPDAAGTWRFGLASRVWSLESGWGTEVIMEAGCASPNLSRIADRWCLTYCTFGETQREEAPAQPNQLFYRTSSDLHDWSAPRPLATSLTAGVRAIDAALLEYEPGGVLLVWKERQTPCAALGRWRDGREVDGQWRRLPSPALPWFENAQLIPVDGNIQLVATVHDARSADSHRPARCTLEVSEAGVKWGNFIPFVLPEEAWNSRERANAAFLLDQRGVDGWFYLVSCGRSQGAWHSDGDYALGLHRSRDLVTWEPPCGGA